MLETLSAAARALGIFIIAYAAYSWWKPSFRHPVVRPVASVVS